MKGWRKLVDWVTSSTHTDGRDWVALLLSLLLAFSVWFIHNLGQNYIVETSMPVRLCSSIEGRSMYSSNTAEITALCNTSGFNHLRISWYVRNHVKTLSLDPSMLHYKSGDQFYVTEKELHDLVHAIYGENARADHFLRDTVFFRFPEENSKRVPVEFVGDISCKPQFTLTDAVRLTPDSILVYGEPGVLENIHFVRTEPVIRMDVDKDMKGTAKLRPLKGTRYSAESVRYSAGILRYVELSSSYTLKVRNVPEDKEVFVLPSELQVSFFCPFPLEADPREEASFYVDYADYEASYGGKCLVKADKELPGVIRWVPSQDMVECVVRE